MNFSIFGPLGYNSTPQFGPKFGAQKFASQNSTPNSSSRGPKSPLRKLGPDLECRKWGCNKWGLRGVWPPVLEIRRNRPFSPFFCLFRPFPEGLNSTWKIQKTEEKGLFPQISSDFLKPPSLKPPFAALQLIFLFVQLSDGETIFEKSR